MSANVRVAELLAMDIGEVIGRTFDQIAFEPRDVSFDGRYEEVALRRGDDYPVFVTLTVAHIRTPSSATHGFHRARHHRAPAARARAGRQALGAVRGACRSRGRVRQLRAAQHELENRNREIAMLAWRAAVGELVAGIAHHLNNPLGALLSTTRHLGERVQDLPAEKRAEIERLLARITKVATRIESNVNAIVKASRSATGAGRSRAAARAQYGLRDAVESARRHSDQGPVMKSARILVVDDDDHVRDALVDELGHDLHRRGRRLGCSKRSTRSPRSSTT